MPPLLHIYKNFSFDAINSHILANKLKYQRISSHGYLTDINASGNNKSNNNTYVAAAATIASKVK